MLADAVAATSELAASSPGAVVLTGRPGYFSAGADLKVVPTLDAEGQRAMVDGINQMCITWYGFPRPVVCAVNGHAIAGGLVFALCGDYRVAASEGRYGLTELRAGVPYPTMALAVVAAELSAPAARRLVLRADLVDAADLRELGAFDEVVPPDDVLDRSLAVAADLASLPAAAYTSTKRRLRAEVSRWRRGSRPARSTRSATRGPTPTPAPGPRRSCAVAELVSLAVADEAAAWEGVGFALSDGLVSVGGVDIVLAGRDAGEGIVGGR